MSPGNLHPSNSRKRVGSRRDDIQISCGNARLGFRVQSCKAFAASQAEIIPLPKKA
ncbi:MAG: hypothetical protein LBU32_24645 [Clostridiales bacterium]|jgi:hypothetical protein|nr:hypothetical protein [Clostridiales bacterium]